MHLIARLLVHLFYIAEPGPKSRRHGQEKIGSIDTHKAFVQGLANFASGPGECPLCRVKIMNVQTHHCCGIFQLAAMTAHVFQPANFPMMPCLKHPALTAGTDQVPDDMPSPAPAAKQPRGTMDLTDP